MPSCAHVRTRPAAFAVALFLASVPVFATPVLALPPSVRQGEAMLAVLESPHALGGLHAELRDARGILLDEATGFELPSASGGRRFGLLLSAGDAAKPGTLRVLVRGVELLSGNEDRAMGFDLGSSLVLEARRWTTETIRLDSANSALRTEPDPRKTAEALALQALLAREDPVGIHDPSAFVFPVDPSSRRSAGFGDRRRYLYAKGGSETSVHAGIDLAVISGTPVRACASGKVVLAALRVVTGYTIVVEHLPGLYSIYMHLSKPEVAAGDLVAAGQEIALSGSTGLSTGPHLHFELRLRGKPVDPEGWVRADRLTKPAPSVQ